MSTVTTIGVDIAKSVFQVHGISAMGEVLIRRRVRRGQVLKFFTSLPPCPIGIAACASDHLWSRELQSLGHLVKLMPPSSVKPYVTRQKNDRADAEAICETVTRPTMRCVETKTHAAEHPDAAIAGSGRFTLLPSGAPNTGDQTRNRPSLRRAHLTVVRRAKLHSGCSH